MSVNLKSGRPSKYGKLMGQMTALQDDFLRNRFGRNSRRGSEHEIGKRKFGELLAQVGDWHKGQKILSIHASRYREKSPFDKSFSLRDKKRLHLLRAIGRLYLALTPTFEMLAMIENLFDDSDAEFMPGYLYFAELDITSLQTTGIIKRVSLKSVIRSFTSEEQLFLLALIGWFSPMHLKLGNDSRVIINRSIQDKNAPFQRIYVSVGCDNLEIINQEIFCHLSTEDVQSMNWRFLYKDIRDCEAQLTKSLVGTFLSTVWMLSSFRFENSLEKGNLLSQALSKNIYQPEDLASELSRLGDQILKSLIEKYEQLIFLSLEMYASRFSPANYRILDVDFMPDPIKLKKSEFNLKHWLNHHAGGKMKRGLEDLLGINLKSKR